MIGVVNFSCLRSCHARFWGNLFDLSLPDIQLDDELFGWLLIDWLSDWLAFWRRRWHIFIELYVLCWV